MTRCFLNEEHFAGCKIPTSMAMLCGQMYNSTRLRYYPHLPFSDKLVLTLEEQKDHIRTFQIQILKPNIDLLNQTLARRVLEMVINVFLKVPPI